MSPLKEQVIELIKSLPDDCTWEDIQYHIYVREKVERGIQDVDEGKVLTHDEVEKKMKKWLKSSGQKQP